MIDIHVLQFFYFLCIFFYFQSASELSSEKLVRDPNLINLSNIGVHVLVLLIYSDFLKD